jgi:ribosomal protein S3AE
MSPEVLAVFASLGGAVIGAVPGLISSFINRKVEDKKQFRELVIKAATESWKTHIEHSASKGILPLEHYIIHTSKMCEIALSGEKITPEKMSSHLQELDSVMRVLVEYAKVQTPKASNA